MTDDQGNCPHCGEPGDLTDVMVPHYDMPEAIIWNITHPDEEERSAFVVRFWHKECLLRNGVGSVAHQTGMCRCYGEGEDEAEPLTDGRTLRWWAKMAVITARRRQSRHAYFREPPGTLVPLEGFEPPPSSSEARRS